MEIRNVIFAHANGASFYEDQEAIRKGVGLDGFHYLGEPVTPGFTTIRMPAAAVSIGLVLASGDIAWGDMMGVQYSAAAGRDPLFDADKMIELCEEVIIPRILDCGHVDFRPAVAQVLAVTDGRRFPAAVEYGVSQALLAATAKTCRLTMAEIICREFDLPLPARPVPLYAQSGATRHDSVDRMILRSAAVLPHGLINSRNQFGPAGETFRSYVRWVVKRISRFGTRGYHPRLHFDVYGCVGLEFGLDAERIADFIASVGDDAPGYIVNIECPADFGSIESQIEGYATIKQILSKRGSNARLVVDERCNTLDDIRAFATNHAADLIQIKAPDVGSVADIVAAALLCKQYGVGAYVGGSATETDVSARVSVHLSAAVEADMMLAKPGLGVDEAMSITGNEQNRLLAILKNRPSGPSLQQLAA